MKVQKSIWARLGLLCCLFSLFASLSAQNFQNQSDLQWVAYPVAPGSGTKPAADWTYHTGDAAALSVMLLYHGVPLTDVDIEYNVAGDCLPHSKEYKKLHLGSSPSVSLPVGTLREPGFLDVQMRCEVEGHTYQNHLKVGFDPERLTPATAEPADFDAFWQQTLALQQQKSPVRVTVTDAPEYSTERVVCQKVRISAGLDRNSCLYGYLSRPRAEGKYPVLVSPPGAGVKHMDPLKTQFYAEQGFIRLDLEIHGIDPALSAEVYQDITHAFGDHHANGYLSNGIEHRDTYYMRHVYAAMLRAVDYLTTLPDWDGRNICVQGNSQGAALSLVLAGLDSRITAVACAHPALSDMAGYAKPGRTGGYPHFGNKYQGVTLTPAVIQTLQYYDVVNFARRITCPVYMTWGYNDNTCPPTTSWTVWNLLRCPKEKYLTPINEHWISTQTRYRQMEFLQRQLK